MRRPAVCLDGPRRGETILFDRFVPFIDPPDGRVLYWQPEPRDAVPTGYVMLHLGTLEWAGRKALR